MDEIIDLGTVTLRGSYLENDRKLHDLIRLNDARCAVTLGSVGFHPELVGDAVPHATEEDVDRALNCEPIDDPNLNGQRAGWEASVCEQGPEPYQSALQTGLKAWREAGRPTPPGPDHPSRPGFTPTVNYPDLDSDIDGF
jgi:hypothetical protein